MGTATAGTRKTSFPKESIRVVLLEGVHPSSAEAFKGEGFQVSYHEKALEGAALHKALAEGGGAHVVAIRSKTELDAKALAASPRLLAVGCFCIGTNQVDLKTAMASGVAVFNSPFSNTRSVAELTIAEVIALHRRLVDQSMLMHKGGWDKSASGAHEVRGRTLGLVGYGHIGSQVSVLAEAMGMKVMFYDIASKLPMGNAVACRKFDELLKASDVVSMHVPATETTHNMLGRSQIKMMRRGSMVINNARGSVVDVPALAEAIKSGHIGGAAFDVFPNEPSGRGDKFASELVGLPNVILTPHVGGSTEEAQKNISDDVVGKLLKYINNGSTSGSVNMPTVDLPEQMSEQAIEEAAAVSGSRRRSHRILHLHRNVPGVLSKMHTAIADLDVNINAEYLQTKGDVGYVVLDIAPNNGERILASLKKMPETIRVRLLW